MEVPEPAAWDVGMGIDSRSREAGIMQSGPFEFPIRTRVMMNSSLLRTGI